MNHGISSRNPVKIQPVTSFSTLLILSCNIGQILDTGTVSIYYRFCFIHNPRQTLSLLGHSIVPGTIPIGTLLYHGTFKNEIPRLPDWTAMDPEHSYYFCEDSGCWHLTLVVSRPLRILYFDGSSAVKFRGGSMDSQDVLIWGEAKPEWIFEEDKRLHDLCEWGKQYRIDGFVRCVSAFPKDVNCL